MTNQTASNLIINSIDGTDIPTEEGTRLKLPSHLVNIEKKDQGSDVESEEVLEDFTRFEFYAKERPQDLAKLFDEKPIQHSNSIIGIGINDSQIAAPALSQDDSALDMNINNINDTSATPFPEDSGLEININDTQDDASTPLLKERYKIFYQSLEYRHNFTRKLVIQFPFLENANVPKKGIDATHSYHKEVGQWLENLFIQQEADIVIVGEYNDLREASDSPHYYIIGRVGLSDEGTRAMSVYSTTRHTTIKGCRITMLDGERVDIKNLDSDYYMSRHIDPQVSQQRLLNLSKSAKGHIGQCVEVMIYNRYMLFVHIKGSGEAARDNLLKVLKPDYVHKIDNNTETIKYVIAGDLNAKISGKKQHDIVEIFSVMRLHSNTGALQGNDHTAIPQQEMNIPGKTSSGHVVHDGIYTPLISNDRTIYNITGSLWPLTVGKEEKSNILGDHKGFLLEVVISHSDKATPTGPFTPPVGVALDENVIVSTKDTEETSVGQIKTLVAPPEAVTPTILKLPNTPVDSSSSNESLVGRKNSLQNEIIVGSETENKETSVLIAESSMGLIPHTSEIWEVEVLAQLVNECAVM